MSDYVRSTGSRSRYHHGDLRTALLEAGEAELAETGIEAFSLRKVAKRAGVSHAAPAHHFGDVSGLLTALAEMGNRRFVGYMSAAEDAAADPVERLLRAGIGYVNFAAENTALFRLVFASEKPDCDEPRLKRARTAAFQHLVDLVDALGGGNPFDDPDAMTDAMAIWSVAHGLADLLASNRLKPLLDLDPEKREEAIKDVLRRVLPAGGRPTD